MQELDVIAVLEALEREGVGPVIDGGWGVDALIGEATRPHSDLDLVVDRRGVAQVLKVLRAISFVHDPSARPGVPARVVLRDRGEREVDLHPVVMDPGGDGWQELDGGAWGLYPAAGLQGRGAIAGEPVRCVTAELQLHHHLGYPWNAKDVHDMSLLMERFGLGLPPPYDRRTYGIPPLPPL